MSTKAARRTGKSSAGEHEVGENRNPVREYEVGHVPVRQIAVPEVPAPHVLIAGAFARVAASEFAHDIAQVRLKLEDAYDMLEKLAERASRMTQLPDPDGYLQEHPEVLSLSVPKAPPVDAPRGLAGAVHRGQQALVKWVADKTLLPTVEFARSWGVTRQALDQAVARGELVAVKVGNKNYYPAAFVQLDRTDVSRVCRALGTATPSEKLLFWLAKQGGLGGLTAAQAVAERKTERVAALARDWAEERGLAHAAETA